MRTFRRSLHYFDAVARALSIRLAAEALHIAPSAVSRAIQQLEEEVGVPLFERTTRGLKLTAAGEAVLAFTSRWQRESSLLADDVRSLVGTRMELVRIAAVEVATYGAVPSAIAEVRALRSGLNVDLQVGHTEAVLESLLNGSADIGVVINLPRRVPVRSLWTACDPVGLVVPAQHRLARRKSVRVADCLQDPLVLADETLMSRHAVHAVLRAAGPHRIAGSASRIVAVKSMVRAGLGVAFLTHLDSAAEVARGEFAYVPLSDAGIEHPFVSVVAPPARKRGVTVDLVIEALKRALPQQASGG